MENAKELKICMFYPDLPKNTWKTIAANIGCHSGNLFSRLRKKYEITNGYKLFITGRCLFSNPESSQLTYGGVSHTKRFTLLPGRVWKTHSNYPKPIEFVKAWTRMAMKFLTMAEYDIFATRLFCFWV